MRIAFALFLAAHGFVHLLYVGQALQKYEVQEGFTWPNGAWSLTWLPDGTVRWVAAAFMALVGVAFLAGGAALGLKWAWWQPLTIVGAGVSILFLVLLWNGRLQALDAQGFVAIGLNAAVLSALLWLHWPEVTV